MLNPSKFGLDRFDAGNCVHKHRLHNLIFDYVSVYMRANVAMISGPAIERHLPDAFKVARMNGSKRKSYVYLVEVDKTVYSEMISRFKKWALCEPSLSNRVRLLNTDITSYDSEAKKQYPGFMKCRLEDLDFCKTLSTTWTIIAHRLATQARECSIGPNGRQRNKCIIFTSSLRGCSMAKTIHILCNNILPIIDAKVCSAPNRFSEIQVSDITPIKELHFRVWRKGRLTKGGLRAFIYKDGSPMFSCVILYK